MFYTHFAASLFFILVFLSSVEHKLSFIFVVAIATLLPDIDNPFSSIGKFKVPRFLQFFSKHRGFIHSFTFLLIACLILVLFIPIFVLPFFLGFSVHLLADSFTKQGIMPFWPYKKTTSWRIKTGGVTETTLFVFLLLVDIIAVVVIAL